MRARLRKTSATSGWDDHVGVAVAVAPVVVGDLAASCRTLPAAAARLGEQAQSVDAQGALLLAGAEQRPARPHQIAERSRSESANASALIRPQVQLHHGPAVAAQEQELGLAHVVYSAGAARRPRAPATPA